MRILSGRPFGALVRPCSPPARSTPASPPARWPSTRCGSAAPSPGTPSAVRRRPHRRAVGPLGFEGAADLRL